MTDLILCLCFLLFFIQMCLFLSIAEYRSMIRTRMAALIAWLVGSITGSKGEEEQSEKSKQSATTSKSKSKTEIKQNKSKVRQRARKANEEPTFNTKLSTPIEDIIEETLSEEKTNTQLSTSQTSSDSSTTEKPIGKSKKKKRGVKKDNGQHKSDDEDVGFSFFKAKSTQPNTSETKPKSGKPLETQVSVEIPIADNVGYSFFPIKEKNRKAKGKSLLDKPNSGEALTAVIAQGITKKSDSSKPSIIDHYKTQSSRKTYNSPPHTTDNSQSFVFVNKVETSVTKTEVKESKKVSSHISYASVVTNNIPEHTDVEEQNYQQVKTNETVELKEELSKEVSSSIEILSQCFEDPDTHIEPAEEIFEDTFETFRKNEELPKSENITEIRYSVCKENSEKSEDISAKNKLLLEGSIEVIEKSIVSSVVDEQNKEADSHFEKNILSSVLNNINQTEDLIKDNYVTNHFEHTQSEEIEIKQEAEGNKGNLEANLVETVVNDNEELNDQVLNDIIEQVIHSEDDNIVSDSIAPKDIKNIKLLVEESKDHLEEQSSSQERAYNFTEVIKQFDENLVNNLTVESSELTQEDSLQFQESEEEAIGDLTSNSERNYLDIKESIPDFQEAFNENPKDFDNVPILTVKSHLQEDSLPLSDDKFISEIVEDFIRAENTQKLNLEPTLFEQKEVQEILAVEQIYQHQESKPIPVEEKPCIKKVAYTTTDNQPVDNQTDIINKDLDGQILDYLSNVNQSQSIENQVNSVDQQLPESEASDSHGNFQLLENSVSEVTKVKEQIEENIINQNKTEILEENIITKETRFKDTSVEDSLIEGIQGEDQTVDRVKTEILVEKIADETKDTDSKFEDCTLEENPLVENTASQSESEEEEVVAEEINAGDYNIGDSQIKENQTEESTISQHQPEEEKVVEEKIKVGEYNIGNSQIEERKTEESSISQHQLEEKKIVGVEINVNEYNIGDSQIEESQTKEISSSQCQPEKEKVVRETRVSENNSEGILTEENSIYDSELELFKRKTLEETEIRDYHIEDNLLNKNQAGEKIVISHTQTEVLEEKFVDSDFIKREKIQSTIESIQVHTSHQEVSVETPQTSTDNNIEESPFAKMTQIRVLTLNDKEHQESTIYRIEKNFVLQFRLGPSLLGRKIKLYCNYPKDTNGVLKEFDRGTYQLLGWCQDEGCKNADDTASFAQIVARIAGSFHYYFIYENEDTEERQGSGYFLVDPVLKYGNDEVLPLDCIQCQTVLAKQLGPFSTWENKLRVAKESGYNVVHFTPVQELGISKSCYSLSEQLKLNPMFNEENGNKPTFEDVERLTNKMRKEWKVLSICDIVLNHTANESEWIKEHPEATYNCVNCPYLRPAYLLDAAFHHFSMDVKKGYYEDRGIPAEVSTEEHLNAILYHFKSSVLEPLKLQELFLVDVNKYLEEFLTLARKTPPIPENSQDSLGEIKVIQDPEFKRLKSTIDIDLALKIFNVYRLDCFDEESRVKRCAEDLKIKLESLNEVIIKEVTEDLNVAVQNVIAGIRYFRVQADGPKFKDITLNHPLVYRYFTDFGSPKSLEEYEEIMYSENGKFLMAHNGWVMNSDPLKNFAAPGTKIYIKRELIAWGDSVKLRYGDKPEDSPYLWDYMRKYVEQTAKIFDGVRLDNCHSTPIPVAEYLLDAARKIRPDLYVVAELFTNSDLTDNIFVNRLGITSLIREAMSAWDSHEEGRLVYRYGGVPVGSFYQPSVRPLVPMVAHALFLDLTHDNPSPVEKRSVFDLLPSTALVNMACCASGTSRGYDELVPHHIHVVDETRQYTEWSDDESLTVGNVKYVNDKFGIIAVKKALNDLHFKLGKEGYNQVYVDQMDPDIVAVTRHNPETHTSYVLIAFTAFGHPDINAGTYQRGIKPLRVEGVLDEIVLEASLSHIDAKSGGSGFTKFESFTKDSTWINGLSEYQASLKQHIQLNQSDIFEEVNSGTVNMFQLNFKNFKPGSIAVVRVSLPDDVEESVLKVRSLISSFSAKKDTELKEIISRMSLSDLNRALYRCDQEERDEGNGFGVYNIPNFSPTVYCGLQGFMSLLAYIRPSNDLGHPFCANLRDGNWAIEYIWQRLKVDDGTKQLGQWIEENTKPLHSIPRYLVPCYFDVIVTGIYINLLEQSYNLMSDFVKHGSTFVRSLSLGSLQFAGYVRSADLPVLSPNLAPPKPPTRKNNNGETVQACVTISAGLPHFSVGYMRNWGRDTFIALRGLLILTGRFEEARQHILGYAACLRHGLIPNLLDGGRNSRFNCRDAIWWWLYCIKSYCEETPNGTAILSDKVSRLFPTDDSPAQPPGAVDQPLHDVIQEALKVHFQGLKFRERNAGRQIDEQMSDAGFNNQIGIHPETGFVFGGNQWNCGTWMDKMGSSEKAGNKGKPATPRDGSAVELVGLSKAAISWLWKLNQEEKYPYDGVERTHKNGAITKWTFKDWAEKIQENFEKNFWVGLKPSSDESRPDLINKKNIYKDSFGASQSWTDYQLRSNFPIAMVAAPEMFDPQHAWAALEQAEKYLLGPLGMKTLDPEDWNYRGDYDNSNDSNDFNVAHGFNYHQGPEWVWPLGFFLRAKLIFAAQNGMLKETLASTKVILSKHFTELQTSPWRGLPELTNSNGSYCRDSSRTQAWSMSCILEVLHDLQQIESKQIIVN